MKLLLVPIMIPKNFIKINYIPNSQLLDCILSPNPSTKETPI